MTNIIGLTGGIASGKSQVAKLLRDKGVAVIDADVLAREAVAKGSPGLAQIVEAFGGDILTTEGTLDRAKMGDIVFADDDKRRALNHIVHPEVARLFMERFAAVAERGDPNIVYEVPLLFENNLDQMMTATILVAVDEATQRSRIQSRDGLDVDDARARIAAQMPLSEKRTRATHVIENDASLELLAERVSSTWETVLASDSATQNAASSDG